MAKRKKGSVKKAAKKHYKKAKAGAKKAYRAAKSNPKLTNLLVGAVVGMAAGYYLGKPKTA